MDYGHYPVPAPLRPLVQAIWFARGDEGTEAFSDPIVPDGCIELVFNLGDLFEQRLPAGSMRQPRALLVGQMTTPTAVAPTGKVDVIGVRIRTPMTAAALDTSLWNVRDALLPADDVLGGWTRDLLAALGACSTAAARLPRLSEGLALLARRARPAPALVAEAVAGIERTHGRARIERLADRAGVSRRHLERRFRDHVGLTPKELARIVRVQQALRVISSGAESTGAGVAAVCGYADQAHLIRDFQALVGKTPTALAPADVTLSGALRDGREFSTVGECLSASG